MPNDFGAGIMIPLLKDSSADSTKSDNYRCLTLSPLISKIFENCLLSKFSSFLVISDLQFGFKSGVGCTDAILTLKAVIDYYTCKGSTISIAALDISKAFDKISHFNLYSKLMDRNAPKCFIDILKCWYTKNTASVRWGSVYASPFTTTAGVRQGGILSPFLFAVYIDELIACLVNLKQGCKINGCFLGCLLYADDILLVSYTLTSLQCMLDVCSSIAEKLDLKFNVKKSMVLRVGQRYKSKCTDLYLSGQPLSYVAVIKYLGISIESGPKFRCSYANVVMKFYRSFNSLYSKCKSASSEVICINLLKSYCLPIILYGIKAVDPGNRDIRKLDKLVSQAVSKIFCTFDAERHI